MGITRGHAAQLLYEAAGSPAVSAEAPFIDIPECYADAVIWAEGNGLIQGVGDEKYLPNRLVSRQEFAVILFRGAGSPSTNAYTLEEFADQASVSGWARDAMRWCVGTGLMKGKADRLLAPDDTLLVAEALIMLQRADGDSSVDEILPVASLAEIKDVIRQAISDAGQPPLLDCRQITDKSNLLNDVRNVYNMLLSEQPALKYAYALDVSAAENGYLQCALSYMPYYTGDYPAGFDGIVVSSLQELIQAARENMTASAPVSIRITDRQMTVDDMNKALQQSGGSYLLCQLSRDGTTITYTPQNDMSRTECLARLTEIELLADRVYTSSVTQDMSQAEIAETLYTWLTDNVRYDHRYYADSANLPYDAMTAYGALNDKLAICGGYAQALQVLFEKAGIPCYTVNGKMSGENHMWNIAKIGGKWGWYDPTSDRGRADYWFNYFGVDAKAMANYVWDADWVERLTGAVS